MRNKQNKITKRTVATYDVLDLKSCSRTKKNLVISSLLKEELSNFKIEKMKKLKMSFAATKRSRNNEECDSDSGNR